MPRRHIPCLLVFAVCQLLLGPDDSLAVTEWDPTSAALSLGSFALSIVVQPPVEPCYPDSDSDRECDPACDDVRACKEPRACTEGCYFPRGRRCEKCLFDDALGKDIWVELKDMKNPNAFELEFGSVRIEDTPARGGEDDVVYISAGYRRYWLHCRDRDRLRLFAGLGVGVYDILPDRELGLNARIGLEYGINPGALDEGNRYFVLELSAVYHELDSGLDATDLLGGVRIHFPRTD